MCLPHCSQRGLSKTQTWSNCPHGKIHCKLSTALWMLYWLLFMLDNVLNQFSPSFMFCHSWRTQPALNISVPYALISLTPGPFFTSSHPAIFYLAPTRRPGPSWLQTPSSGREYQYCTPTPNFSLANSCWALRSPQPITSGRLFLTTSAFGFRVPPEQSTASCACLITASPHTLDDKCLHILVHVSLHCRVYRGMPLIS